MSISNVLDWSYWFYQPFMARGLALWVLVGGFLLFVLASLVLRFLRSHEADSLKKELMRRFGDLFFWTGIVGLFWMFMRQERIPFFAWRFWLLFFAVGFGWWTFRIIWYWKKRMPKIKEEKLRKEALEKYLPKSK